MSQEKAEISPKDFLLSRKLFTPADWTRINKYPENRGRAIIGRATNIRAALIYMKWLEADDKEKALVELAKEWHFKRPSDVRKIIKLQQKSGVSIARYASKIEAIRQVRVAQVAVDNDFAQAELDSYLERLYDLRDQGVELVTDEITERTGDKASLTESKIPIQKAINDAMALKNTFYESEAKAMSNFEGVPANQRFQRLPKGSARVTIEADAEFMSEWDRLMGKKCVEHEVTVE